jgi:hypothetical protein
MRRTLTFVFCAAVLAVSARADSSRSFSGQLVGSTPGQHVAGVAAAGAPWVVAESEFNVSPNGQIEVQIRGLLLTATGTVGPVTMVNASLVCGDVVEATSVAVPLTTVGNASIHDRITVPSPCIAPALLIRIAAAISGPVVNGPFIAVNAMSGGKQD